MQISKIQHHGMQMVKVDKTTAPNIIKRVQQGAHSMDILRKSSRIANFKHTLLSFYVFNTKDDRKNCINEIQTHLDRVEKQLPSGDMFVRILPEE